MIRDYPLLIRPQDYMSEDYCDYRKSLEIFYKAEANCIFLKSKNRSPAILEFRLDKLPATKAHRGGP